MIELTVLFEIGFQAAETNYEDLVHIARQTGYNTHLIIVEVGAQGVAHMAGSSKLKQELGLTQTVLSSLLSCVSQKSNGKILPYLVLKKQNNSETINVLPCVNYVFLRTFLYGGPKCVHNVLSILAL